MHTIVNKTSIAALNDRALKPLACLLLATIMANPVHGQAPPGAASAADPKVEPVKPAPAKLQALVGAWGLLQSGKKGPVPDQGDIPFTPVYEAKRAELMRKDQAGEVIQGRNRLCKPTGMPDMMTFGFVVSANADYMTVIGGYGTFRPVLFNQTQHTASDKLFPSYQGENLGSWDGDTLVIDSIGYDPTNEITYGLPFDDPDVHIVERWRLVSKNELQVVITIDSPLALTKPYTYTMTYARKPSSDITSQVVYCDQPLVNDTLDLTPPKGGYIPPNAE